MAINKAMQMALKLLSYPDLDVSKTYKMERAIKELVGTHPAPEDCEIWNLEVPVGDHGVPVRMFRTQGTQPTGGIVYFHGGGWVTGNIDSYTRVCSNIARATGRVVASVDYRLAPEFPFPAGVEDCYGVARWAYQGGGGADLPVDGLTLMGDSAGGNLAAVTALLARDRGEFSVPQQILLYPATANRHGAASPYPSAEENGTDYLLTNRRIEEYLELYIQREEDWNSPYFAPLLAEDLSRQPRTLIITAEYDPLRDEGEDYGRRLVQAGNLVEVHRLADALHGFISLPQRFEHVQKTMALVRAFLEGGAQA